MDRRDKKTKESGAIVERMDRAKGNQQKVINEEKEEWIQVLNLVHCQCLQEMAWKEPHQLGRRSFA